MDTAESCNALKEQATSSWWYSWGAKSGFANSFCDDPVTAENESRNAGMEFIPMFWNHIPPFDGTRMVDDEVHSNLQQSQYLLTFNEPELHDQANLSPAQAAQMWPTIEAIKNSYNIEIIAPCVTQDLGVSWYEQWLSECNSMYERDCEFDYTCIHMYYQPYTEETSVRCDSSDYEWACIQQGGDQGPSRAEYKLNQWTNAYPGKQIWVTEYACAPWGSDNGCSAQEQTDIMSQLTPLLEASPHVFRYAWFAVYGGTGSGGTWIGNGLNENVWDDFRGVGCQDRKWIGGFGNAGWQIQTKQECLAKADADVGCVKPLALSIDDDSCYCATTPTCNLVPTWDAMRTWIEVGDRNSATLTSMGDLYETFGTVTSDPTMSPTVSPTASPTASPTKAPTKAPTLSPTVSPTVSPTKTPTKTPTASPTVSPTASPTKAPTKTPTVSPTVSPTPGPTIAPIQIPTCPEDLLLIDHDGVDEFPQNAVQIIDQSRDVVTVRINQAYSTMELSHFYYQYNKNHFNKECYEEQGWTLDEPIEITIQCTVHTEIALLELWVADPSFSSESNAVVPNCCHPTVPDDVPVTKYEIRINCLSACPQDIQ